MQQIKLKANDVLCHLLLVVVLELFCVIPECLLSSVLIKSKTWVERYSMLGVMFESESLVSDGESVVDVEYIF